MSSGAGALSSRTVLEVADGLCWSDPRLGLSLAEHALRLAGDDPAARAAAQRCVIRALAEVDRFEEVVSRATPLLEDAAVRQDRDDLAGLLVDLAGAAIGFGDDAVAARLVAPVGPGVDLPHRTSLHAALVRARLAAGRGDVAGTDQAARNADLSLRRTPEPEASLVRRDLARARAAARSRSGDPSSALPIVSEVVSADPGADPDGGRRSLLATADQVDLLLDLGRPDEALQRGTALPEDAAPSLVRPASRVRLALAERVHLARDEHDEARSLARSAAAQLEDAGHDAAAARAWEVVASAAERGGDLGSALAAVRHGHALESRSRDRRDPALRALATLAASAPELPARPTPAPPDPAAARATLSEVESLLADARSSVAEGALSGVDGRSSPARRRGHRRPDVDDSSRPPGVESAPETLARLLGANGVVPPPAAGADANGVVPPPAAGAGGNGVVPPPAAGAVWSGAPDGGPSSRFGADGPATDGRSPAGPGPSATPDVRARTGGAADEQPAELSTPVQVDGGVRPRSDAFSTAPGVETSPPTPATPPAEHTTGTRWDPGEFPHIDPADPLGTGTPGRGSERPRDGVAVPGRVGAGVEEASREVGPQAPDERCAPGVGSGAADRREGAPRGRGTSAPVARPTARSAPVPDGSPSPAPRPDRADDDRDELAEELAEELALTLAGLLAEYRLPEAPPPPPRDDLRPPEVAVPSARRHVSGSMPLPATDHRFAPRPTDEAPAGPRRGTTDGPVAGPHHGASGGRAPRGENGARLANLLAEAMDAFRHTGPEEGGRDAVDPGRGPGRPARDGDPARGNGDGRRVPGGRADGSGGPGLEVRRG